MSPNGLESFSIEQLRVEPRALPALVGPIWAPGQACLLVSNPAALRFLVHQPLSSSQVGPGFVPSLAHRPEKHRLW